jgi:hypothetical protein
MQFKRRRQPAPFHKSWASRWRTGFQTAFLVAFGSLFIGGWLTADTERIRSSIGRFLHGPRDGRVDWSVLLFLLVSLIWAIALYIRLHDEDVTAEHRRTELMTAITGAPNARVFVDYGEKYLAAVLNALSSTAKTELDTPDTQIKAIEAGVGVVLRAVSELAAEFGRADGFDKNSYGANIMLIARRDSGLPEFFPAQLLGQLHFHERDAISALDAMLYLPRELLIKSIGDAGSKEVPVISLPIPKTLISKGYNMVLPGAPRALLSGQPGVYGDTSTLAVSHCKDFSKPVYSEVEGYFAHGDGKSIKSFASFRIGTGALPIGVLNIDASRTHLLGPATAHATFFSLVSPVLFLLRDPISEYARLRAATGTLFGEAAAAAPQKKPGE